MGKVKAPDIPMPEKRKRTTEDYISAYTRHCSNELVAVQDIDGKRVVSYHEWLAPENARSVALIAKENIIRETAQWLAANALSYFYHDPVKDDYGFEFTDMIRDMKEALDRTDV